MVLSGDRALQHSAHKIVSSSTSLSLSRRRKRRRKVRNEDLTERLDQIMKPLILSPSPRGGIRLGFGGVEVLSSYKQGNKGPKFTPRTASQPNVHKGQDIIKAHISIGRPRL